MKLHQLSHRVLLQGRTAIALAALALALPAYSQVPDALAPAPDGPVYGLAVQADGKVLVGGAFGSLAGQACPGLGRLNADGSLDGSFSAGLPDGAGIVSMAVQTDGRILIAGSFQQVAGRDQTNLARLNANGSLDGSFQPQVDPNTQIYCLALQSDGKVLAGGSPNLSFGGVVSDANVVRLNSDGSLDAQFQAPVWPGLWPDAAVQCLAVQADGKVLAGGSVPGGDGGVGRLERLNSDGSLDNGFSAPELGDIWPSTVYTLVLQGDGKLLVGGLFQLFQVHAGSNLARLNADGTADAGFVVTVPAVSSLGLQADGKILVGGYFTQLDGQSQTNLGRLNPDGSGDSGFVSGASGPLYAVALQGDGMVLVGGSFTDLCGQARTNLGRLNGTGAATQNLTLNGGVLSWMRGGNCPEVQWVQFDFSTDGTAWSALGTGTRVAGGWQLSGVSAPANARIRALGLVTGGQCNGSSWFVEGFGGAPFIASQPVSCITNAGNVAALSVQALGTAPLSYQWSKGAVALSNGGNVSGADTATLTLSNVLGADAGSYSVVVSNGVGSVTSATVSLSVGDPVIWAQPQGQSVWLGQTAVLEVGASGTALSYQWRKDEAALASANSAVLTLNNVQQGDGGNYDVVVSGSYGRLTSAVAVVTLNLVEADGLAADISEVHSLAVQPDGKVLVGGRFGLLYGDPGLGRLNADGSLDGSFGAMLGGATVGCVALEPEGRLLFAGTFQWWPGYEQYNLGSQDGSFEPQVDPNTQIYCLAVQPDGKVLAGGSPNLVFAGVVSDANVVRVNSDGSLDATFQAPLWPGLRPDAGVWCLAVQADGKVLAGGSVDRWLGRLERLNSDGSLDTGFNAPVVGSSSFWPAVNTLVVQADGKILVGGSFTSLGNQACTNLGRLNADGTVDGGFVGPVFYRDGEIGEVDSLALQADGKIVAGGYFTQLDGQSQTNLGRLNPDGSLDRGFISGASGPVYAVALQGDGSVLVGGSFTNLCGQARTNLGRLNVTGAAAQNLTLNGGVLSWMRGGNCPEVQWVQFDFSTDGTAWSALGTGTRVAGGWQLSGVSTPANALIRARGVVTGGQYNGSSWFLEGFGGVPFIASQPVSCATNAGSVVAFGVQALGGGPLTYQWSKDAAALSSGGNVSGANTATLTLSNVLGGDAGSYSVVVRNSLGGVTSVTVSLSVVDPLILAQPQSQFVETGETAVLQVGAVGTGLGYQWRKDGAPVTSGISAVLTLDNVQPGDGGSYDVVVSGSYGRLTSAVAVVTVTLAGGTITNCTQANLEAALSAGGRALFASGGTLTLTSTVSITQSALLDAQGHDVVISGGGAVRLFQVASNATFRINGVTLAGGAVRASDGFSGDYGTDGEAAYGAAILNLGGTVILTGCTLTNHSVWGGAAGQSTNPRDNPYWDPIRKGGDALGAAIYNAGGTLALTNCILTSNTANGGMSVYSYTIAGPGGNAQGGAIYGIDSTVTIVGCRLDSNSALGGSLSPQGSGSGSDAASGGGLGGALFLSDDSSGTIIASSFAANTANGGNGRQGQPAGVGQGGAVLNAGSLTISDTTFEQNESLGNVGTGGWVGGRGGAIYSTGALVVNRCTFASNQAAGGGTAWNLENLDLGAEGGAIGSPGNLAATNSTLATNRVAAADYGTAHGGGMMISGGTAALVNLTIAANRADSALLSSLPEPVLGGGLCVASGTTTVRGSILAYSSNAGDLYGPVEDGGYNICSDGTAGFSAQGSLNQADPLLLALTNNGGPTATMALQAGSPALDAIPSGFPPTDQRGVARPQGPAADIGAFEADDVPGAIPPLLTVARSATEFIITWDAEAGRTYRVLASSDRNVWAPVATNSTVTAGPAQWAGLIATGRCHFYRVVSP